MSDTTTLVVNLFDGRRESLDPDAEPHVQVFNGDSPSKRVGDAYKKANSFRFPDLEYSDNFIDNFRVIASADGYYDAGFVPVKMSRNQTQTIDLMLLPKHSSFNFTSAHWNQLPAKRGELYELIRGGLDDATAQARYEHLMEQDQSSLAALLNITAALADIHLPIDSGTTALSYYRQLIWDNEMNEAPTQDRFYAWADNALIDRVVEAAHQGHFTPEHLAGWMHHGASRSYKQNQFAEANVQITFHENLPSPEGLVKVETDIDYYKNPVAHALLEVIPNHFTKGKTNPVQAYALRWIAARTQKLPEFGPLYTIEV